MSGVEVKNAVITGTTLGIEDHGMMTCYLTLDYGGTIQSFGGYAFDRYDEDLGRRVGHAFGIDFVLNILEVAGVSRWEDLPGKHVRARADYSKVYAIGHILKDKWFEVDKLVKEDER